MRLDVITICTCNVLEINVQFNNAVAILVNSNWTTHSLFKDVSQQEVFQAQLVICAWF